MRFTKHLPVLALSLAGVQAAIVGLNTPAGPYHATKSSSISLNFETAPTFAQRDDFSIALGLYASTAPYNDPQIGALWANVDLVARGLSSTGNGNFTLTLPLAASSFVDGAGQYNIVTAVTFGNGPGLSTGVQFFKVPLNVTV
ncbi:hypothetical protein AURDEDRAFT_165337 [Auricularia subglabra TFB-10046 SS5]|nr:hypothetical protein AURDEDRAFT_165337 [Auricularia subglabra TFB-10046 SS5]